MVPFVLGWIFFDEAPFAKLIPGVFLIVGGGMLIAWAQFGIEILRNQVRDSTWQAVTHLIGESGAINLATAVCYYEMMARLNRALDLEVG